MSSTSAWDLEVEDPDPIDAAAVQILARFAPGATLPEEHRGLAELAHTLDRGADIEDVDRLLRSLSYEGYLRGAVSLVAGHLRTRAARDRPNPELALRLASELMDALAPELGAALVRGVLANPDTGGAIGERANLMLAEFLHERGDLRGALRHFEAVLAADVRHTRALRGWSDCSRELERRGIAVEHRGHGTALLDGLAEVELDVGVGMDRYELGRPLGRGRHAVVYQAWDRTVGRQVAIKRLLGDDARGDGVPARVVEARFFAEARTLARVRSAYVVALLDVQPRHRFVALELCTGGNLRLALRRGLVGPADVERVGEQLRLALDAVHCTDAIHRDVKPANILVREAKPMSPIALADFGLAIERSGTGPTAGTLRYLAPEVRGGETATAAADRFSAGVVLLELALAPSPLPSTFDRLDEIEDAPDMVPMRDGLPREWAARLRRLLSSNPEERSW